MRRRLLRFSIAVAAVFGLSAAGLAGWLHTDVARHRFESLLSNVLHRQVQLESLDVGWSVLGLQGLTLSDPWSDEPALAVERGELELQWSALLRGGVSGTLHADGFTLNVRKRGEETNLHGIRRHHSGRALDLVLSLEGGEVTLFDEDRGESLSVEGMSLCGRVQRADLQKVVRLQAGAAAIRARGVSVYDLAVDLQVDTEGIDLRSLRARLGQGTLGGEGRLAFDAQSSWRARVEARQVGLQSGLLPVVVATFPAAAGVSNHPEGQTAGDLSLTAELRGSGLSMTGAAKTLRGTLSVRLDDLVLPRETLAVRVASLWGRSATPLELGSVSVDARLEGPWVRVVSLRQDGADVDLPFDGRVALDGRLDLDVDVLPLLRVTPGLYASVRHRVVSLPIRIGGTTDHPQIRPPSAGALARAAAGAWFEQRID